MPSDLKNVCFAYSSEEGEKEVLHNIDLDIRHGEVIALVGPSGAGKSTLVNLIPRFFDVTSGRVLIDGHDLRDVSLRSLRDQIGKVTQETILFNDTVRNNIAYGQPDVPLSRVRRSRARPLLPTTSSCSMPDGYDTIIGEKGFRLSGGERQRLAIARAILKDAPVLILDEATSALDTESESLVQTALSNLMTGRTVVVIAHRLSTVRRATRIAVLEQGRITAIGSHEELLQISPTYQKLYRLQFIDVADIDSRRTGSARKGGCVTTLPAPVSSAIRSMTGFARISGRVSESLGFTLSLKSVNHRFLDLHMRLPSGTEVARNAASAAYSSRNWSAVTSKSRSTSTAAREPKRLMTRALVETYLTAFRSASAQHGLLGEPDLNAILRLPGIFNGDNRSSDRGSEEESRALEAAVLNVLPAAHRIAQRHARAGRLPPSPPNSAPASTACSSLVDEAGGAPRRCAARLTSSASASASPQHARRIIRPRPRPAGSCAARRAQRCRRRDHASAHPHRSLPLAH